MHVKLNVSAILQSALLSFPKMPNNLQATGLGGGCYCVTLP